MLKKLASTLLLAAILVVGAGALRPFSSVVYAGHATTTGLYCECGSSSDCICDEGEIPVRKEVDASLGGRKKSHTEPTGEVDLGSLGVFALLAMLMIRRFQV